MVNWDDDTPQLRSNLAKVFSRVRDEALRREPLTIEVARDWQLEIMQGLVPPDPKLVGRFRGEAGLENYNVSIAMRYGLPPFLRIRPRPGSGYGRASAAAMQGDRSPTVALFRQMYINSLLT